MEVSLPQKEQIKKEIKAIISQHLDLKKFRVFFFGSRVTGKGNERSDIDIGIEGNEAVPLEIIARIKQALEATPFLYSFDVVDFYSADDNFKKVAKEKIEEIL